MENYTLSKADLPKLIKEIIGKNKVYAPVENDGVTLFNEINNPSDIYLNYFNSKIPPKSLLFQQTETLFKFTPGTKGKIDPPDLDDQKTMIFGIRPCDAKSFSILDHTFTGDFDDPYFINHRKNTILVGMSCTKPGINCFCTSFNDSPAQAKYLDILLTDIGDKYLVEITNEKGKQFAKDLKKHMHPAKESDTQKKKEIEKKAIEQITRTQQTAGITEKLDKIFENPFWKEVANKCVSCGTCTYLCPTCHCFDIQDESTLTKGARVRVWDTCMNPEYTLHASGFNPRPARTNRVRNRIYHKYNYYPKNFDIIACVGCGRCIDLCPVNIDIIDVVTKAGEVKP